MNEFPPDVTAAALKAGADIVRVAADSPNGRSAAANLTEPLVIMTRTVRNWFLPLALHNAKREKYFEGEFAAQLGPKLEQVPEAHRVPPKPSIAVPALEGLGYSYEEEELREWYLNLLVSSADARVANDVHPSYSEIIKQLSAAEVPYLSWVLPATSLAVVKFRAKLDETHGFDTARHLLNFQENDEPVVEPQMEVFVNNWQRLGLVEVDYGAFISVDGAYDWVEGRPEFADHKHRIEANGRSIDVLNGLLSVTGLGRRFAEVVLPKDLLDS